MATLPPSHLLTRRWLIHAHSLRPCCCSEVELAALLQYVANQLKSTESLDLLVLKEILTTMTVRGWQQRQGGI